mgnify:FL=1
MIINAQGNQSHVLNPEAGRILDDRLYREEMEFLLTQENPHPLIDRHIPEENWDSTFLERNGLLLALRIHACITTGCFILNKFTIILKRDINLLLDRNRHPQVIITRNDVLSAPSITTNLAIFHYVLGVQQ